MCKSWPLPAFLFTACTLLVSCVPNAVVYYQPSMVGGKVEVERCVPTKSVVKFAFWQPGVHPLHGTAYISSHGDKTTFFLNLSPFYSQTIAFTDEPFRIVDSETQKNFEIVSTDVYRDDGGTSYMQAYPIRKPGKPARRVGALFYTGQHSPDLCSRHGRIHSAIAIGWEGGHVSPDPFSPHDLDGDQSVQLLM